MCCQPDDAMCGIQAGWVSPRNAWIPFLPLYLAFQASPSWAATWRVLSVTARGSAGNSLHLL